MFILKYLYINLIIDGNYKNNINMILDNENNNME